MDYKYTIYKRTLFPPQIRHTGQEWGQTPVQASPEPQEPREPPRDQQRGMMWVKTNQKNYHNQCDPFAGVIAKRNTGQMTMWVMEPEALLLLNVLFKYLDFMFEQIPWQTIMLWCCNWIQRFEFRFVLYLHNNIKIWLQIHWWIDIAHV